eukprot:TRINITY_DN8903_c0_g2_i1.p1 TRINITY_DN8903_c0_g2~~TRINITY_DN8903_c0_g2_i1.p1  ORF type:complete len:495 (+),score=90.47 TRINITY_DN8903_c0_g2_i1:25-1509(+)
MDENVATGEEISHVELPTWADGDPWKFVRMHREALECDYVSAHLHEWIDLIFGYKQKGQASIDAQNVFYYLTYADAVEIDKITDKVHRDATIAQINNFGQTPLQLFTEPHTSRLVSRPGTSSTVCSPRREPMCLSSVNMSRVRGKHMSKCSGAVGFMDYGGEKHDKLCTLGLNCRLLFPEYYCQYGDKTGALRVFHIEGQLAAVHDGLHDGVITTACLASGTLRSGQHHWATVVTGGVDGVVGVWKVPAPMPIKKIELLRQLDGHGCMVTFVAASHEYSVLVSGDCRGRSLVWDLNKLSYVRQLSQHSQPVVAIVVNDSVGNIATCCTSEVKVHSINGMLLQTVQAAGCPPITALAVTPGNYAASSAMILTGHQNGTIQCWGEDRDLVNRQSLASPCSSRPGLMQSYAEQQIRQSRKSSGDLSSPSEGQGLSGVGSPNSKAYRLATGATAKVMPLELCWTLEGHQSPVSWIHTLQDQLRMLSSDLDGNIWQWSA